MKGNRLLYVSLLVSKAIRALIFLGLAVVAIMFIHWHIDKNYYKSVQVSVRNGGVNISEGKTETAETMPEQPNNSGKTVYLNDLTPFSGYLIFFQICVTLILSYFITQEVIRILKSVQGLQPFNIANIKSFRRIGYLCLFITLLNSLHFLITNQTSFISFSINFTLLIFMLVTFILAEIFKEGQKLYEQDKLTI